VLAESLRALIMALPACGFSAPGRSATTRREKEGDAW
jgi:hypothetical protein